MKVVFPLCAPYKRCRRICVVPHSDYSPVRRGMIGFPEYSDAVPIALLLGPSKRASPRVLLELVE